MGGPGVLMTEVLFARQTDIANGLTINSPPTAGQRTVTNSSSISWDFSNPSTAIANIITFTSSTPGGVPASGGGTTNFLNAAGAFSAPPGVPSGSSGYIQFANGTSFASDSGLFWDNTNKRLGVGTASPLLPLQITARSGVAAGLGLVNSDYTGPTGTAFTIIQGASSGSTYTALTTINGIVYGVIALNPNGGAVSIGSHTPGSGASLDARGGPLYVSNSDYVDASTGSLISIGLNASSGTTNSVIQSLINGRAGVGNLSINPSGGSISIGTSTFISGVALTVAGGDTRLYGYAGVADIRLFGTVVCNANSSSGVGTAVAAAITAGYSKVLLPKNCWWINPGGTVGGTAVNLVPANLTVIGEDWLTSVIASNDWNTGGGPANDVTVGSFTTLQNVGIIGTFCYNLTDGTNGAQSRICPVGLYRNQSGTSGYSPSNYPYQGMVFNTGTVTTPTAGGITGSSFKDEPAIAVNNASIGDAIYISTHSGGNTGTGLRVDQFNSTGDDGNAAVFLTMKTGGLSSHLLTLTDVVGGAYAGSGLFTSILHGITSGNVFNTYHDTSALSGDFISANLGNGGGSFSGNFLNLQKGGSAIFKVDNTGIVTAAADMKVTGNYWAAGTIGVTCSGGVTASTVRVVNGIVTHC